MRRPRQSLTLVTAPAVEPVTVSEAKAWLRLDGDAEDTLLEQLITAARTSAEQYIRGSIISQTRKLTLDLTCSRFGDNLPEGVYDMPVTALYGGLPTVVELPAGPVQSVTLVKTYGLDNTESTYSSGNYYLDTAGDRLVLNYGAIWPTNLRPQASCAITYVAGYGVTSKDVPEPIKRSILIHVASLYEQRGQCDDGAEPPPGAKQLLNQYRKLGSRG
jgi:hypothetical protein